MHSKEWILAPITQMEARRNGEKWILSSLSEKKLNIVHFGNVVKTKKASGE